MQDVRLNLKSLLIVSAICGALNSCSSGTAPVAAADTEEIVAGKVYAFVHNLAASAGGQKAIASVKALSWSQVYQKLQVSLNSKFFDDLDVDGARELLLSHQQAITNWAKTAGTLGQTWRKLGIDPVAATADDYQRSFQATSAAYASLTQGQSLGLDDDDEKYETSASRGYQQCANVSNLLYSGGSLGTAGCILAEFVAAEEEVPVGFVSTLQRYLGPLGRRPCMFLTAGSLESMGVNGLCTDLHDAIIATAKSQEAAAAGGDPSKNAAGDGQSVQSAQSTPAAQTDPKLAGTGEVAATADE